MGASLQNFKKIECSLQIFRDQFAKFKKYRDQLAQFKRTVRSNLTFTLYRVRTAFQILTF